MRDLKVTVATVVYNNVDHIKKTIDCVLEQSYKNIEYIVIDGGSDDGTAEVVESYSDRLSYWESNKDKGVYFAMNKAIGKATGEYINFMNCGDWFASKTVIEELIGKVEGSPDFFYGDHDVILDSFTKHKEALPVDMLWKHMIFSHQAVFTKTSLMRETPFDTSYRVAADFDFIFGQYEKGSTFQHIPIKVACFQDGGLSRKHVLKGYEENWNIVKKYRAGKEVDNYYQKLIAKQKRLIVLENILPKPVFNLLMRIKNKVISS